MFVTVIVHEKPHYDDPDQLVCKQIFDMNIANEGLLEIGTKHMMMNFQSILDKKENDGR